MANLEVYTSWKEYSVSSQDFYLDEENAADCDYRNEIDNYQIIGKAAIDAYEIVDSINYTTKCIIIGDTDDVVEYVKQLVKGDE